MYSVESLTKLFWNDMTRQTMKLNSICDEQGVKSGLRRSVTKTKEFDTMFVLDRVT